ncbi:MAG: bifunctional 2-C-methyl-D-erythritol 4-phosphate cytidylyltransferase/2-C-methyl-D-erythritol 2,4-cyclodiphosphate synthase [Alphaproteobacteria bacterium]|nr:MAG: bifunctional 2-C-methyl-D-erythritol 4-phosphate cytidylyltransferase/2-C-methyl-D-erythritol 2,4-cyclodiphosphate synthase [Alphaproteobacteria bacterium]
MQRSIALVVAAGRGLRAGGGLPKQYRPIGGRAVLRRTVEALLADRRLAAVQVVIAEDAQSLYEAALTPVLADPRLLPPVTGGASRQESVRLGLEALAKGAEPPDVVLIHDAARPFPSSALIGRVMDAVTPGQGAVPALPLVDTVKRADEEGMVVGTVDRHGLWRVQTPQGFPFAPILAAHRRAAGAELTDDAAVAEAAGLPVRLVPGDEKNFKITTAADFLRAERLLAACASRLPAAGGLVPRVGQGFDVHRFGPGDHVMLCGIAVPCDAGLIGHSDADVVLHAVTDAILGALALGDIGQHFPPSDPRFRNAPSARFVKHALDLAAARGGRLAHCDVTIIGEKPRIAPWRERLRGHLADLLKLGRHAVSLKATTTEKLGFMGRGEGLAAQAVVTLLLPTETAG